MRVNENRTLKIVVNIVLSIHYRFFIMSLDTKSRVRILKRIYNVH